MLKRILVLTLAILLILGCVACAKEPEPTEPVVQLPTNVFTNYLDDLNYIVMDGQMFRINSVLPDKLKEMGYKAGTDDTATALYLGYPKSDAKYLYYQYDNESINCVYCCTVGETMTTTISYRIIEPAQLGISNASFSQANHKTYFANYLSPDKTVDDVMAFLGQPESAETNSSGFITKLIYKHKNAEGKVDNKLEVEFVGERVYKITDIRLIPQQ